MTTGILTFREPSPPGLVTWNRLALNGGGTKTGISFADDGTALCRSDISFGYRWNGSQWNPVTTQQHLPRPAYDGYAGVRGVTDIQIAPSDNQRLYCYLVSAYTLSGSRAVTYLYKSSDGGDSWTATNWPSNSSRDNTADFDPVYSAESRLYKRVQRKFGIDPANPDVVYASNAGKKPQVTFDGGTTWADVPDIPVGTTAVLAYEALSATGGSGGTSGAQTVTLLGGTYTTAATVNVNISGGAITSISGINDAGSYSVFPNNPVAVSGAGLTGATLNIVSRNAQLGAVCWTFDRSGGTVVVGGKTVTKNIYVAVEGGGIYRSTDGGVSFSQISSSVGLINPTYADISPDGVFYVTDYDGTHMRLNRYNGSWTTILSDTYSPGTAFGSMWSHAASKDAAHPGRLVVVATPASTSVQKLYYSDDYGTTLSSWGRASFTINDTDSPWYTRELKGLYNWENTHLAFNPASPDDLWMCWGQGIVKTTLSYPPSTTVWNSITTGLETSVCDDIVHESGASGVLQITADLLGFWRSKASLDTAPTDSIMPSVGGYGSGFFPGNENGQSGAIDPYNTNHMVTFTVNPAESGYSLDGGVTWTPFAGSRHVSVGLLATIILVNGTILLCDYYGWAWSTDWGATWTSVGIDAALSIPTNGNGGWGSQLSSVPSRTGCPDGVDPNTFYIYNALYRSGPSPPVCKGTYKSTDGGQNFVYQGTVTGSASTSDPYPGGQWVAFMRCVPGISGHLFACTGFVAPSAGVHPVAGTDFKRSTDGATSWSSVTGMKEVNAFGFGKAKPGGAYASLCVAGFYNGVYGIWVSDDLAASWTQLTSAAYGPWPITNDKVQVIDGDKDIYGRWYIGFQGSGGVYCDLVV